jgi:NTP pyrophosphatase (non-canonical NTP hydrolase)
MAALRKKRQSDSTQILLFPAPAGNAETNVADSESTPPHALVNPGLRDPVPGTSVVICGSFRKDPEGLAVLHERFLDLHCSILSPTNVGIRREEDGFVYMRGEEAQTPETLERRHLDAIERADFVWLHAPDGYVGLSASLEIGYATAIGTPVFCMAPLQDPTLRTMVRTVDRPEDLVPMRLATPVNVPKPAIRRFQNYYRKVAVQRGYERESAQNCLLLMVEEVGELARGLRRDQKLTRHHASNSESLKELADVFIYVIHMANILDADLGEVVREKETANWTRFLQKLHA